MKEQLQFVQILRGFAAIAVVLFHLDGFTLTYFKHSLFNFSYGYDGLGFFFALTGFIITYVHFRETQHHSSVKKFLLKRFVRVYPFYWLVLLIIIGLESPDFHYKPSLRSTIDPTTVEGLGNVIKNIVLYPLPDSAMPVGIAWGLSHAIVFYLLFALGIKLRRNAAKIIFGLWLLAIILNSFHIFPQTMLIEAVAGTTNVQILIGCIAGYLFVKDRLKLKTGLYVFVFSAIVVAALTIWNGFNGSSLLFTSLMGISFASLLYCAASYDRQKLAMKSSRKYAPPILVLIGDAAYSIFLTHIIFVPYLCTAFNKVMNVQVVPDFFKNMLIAIIFLLTIVAGIATYLVIERPMLNFLRKQFRLRRQKKSWI